MRTEKQSQQLVNAKRNILRKPLSNETKEKIGNANRKQIKVSCSYCNNEFTTTTN